MCNVCERSKDQARIFNGLLDLLITEHTKRTGATIMTRTLQGYVLISRVARHWVEIFETVDKLPEGIKKEEALEELTHFRRHLLEILGDVRQVIASVNPTITMLAMVEADKDREVEPHG